MLQPSPLVAPPPLGGIYYATTIGYTITMTTKPVVNFVIDPALLKRVDEYHHKHRFPTRSAAMKYLIAWALKQNPKPTAEDLAACQWDRKGAKS
jgi:hypothetical protein